jgi:hypothetical protein
LQNCPKKFCRQLPELNEIEILHSISSNMWKTAPRKSSIWIIVINVFDL